MISERDCGELLDDIGVAAPCDADWEAMPGDERVRRCPACRLNVFNVAALTRREAAELIARHEGARLCVRLLRRRDGTLITADCRERLRAARRRGRLALAAALVLACLLHLGIRVAIVRRLWDELTMGPPAIDVPVPAPPAVHLMGAMAPPPAPPRVRALGHATMGKPMMPRPTTKMGRFAPVD